MSAERVEDWVAGLLSPEAPRPAAAAKPATAPAVAGNGAGVSAPAAPVPRSAPPDVAGDAAVEPAPAGPPLPPVELPQAPARYVTFRVERETYALDVLRVREVLRSAEVVPVPGAPASVLGVINLRGSIVPVVDARHRLGLAPPEPDGPSRVLIMESGWQAVGLRVDSVADVTTVTPDECEPPPAVCQGEQSRCLRAVVRRGDEFILLVDVDDLLPRNPGPQP